MILVTGATGFLGKRVCKQLQKANLEYEATSLSLGTDLRNEEQTLDLFEKIRPYYVMHCASYVGGIQFGLKYAGEIYRNGLLMQVNLFEACRKYNVKRLVNPIANCAYPGEATFFKESEFWDGKCHDSVLTYGMVRKMSYIGALAYQKQYGLDVVNLIPPNMYGPDDHFEPERSHALGALIVKFVEAKEKGIPEVCIWGTGAPIREWMHVDDGAAAMIKALNIAPYIDPINIGIGKGISIKDTAELIGKIVGYKGKLVFDTSKPDGAMCKTLDGSLGEKLLKWKPNIDFEDGLKETIAWFTQNKNRF